LAQVAPALCIPFASRDIMQWFSGLLQSSTASTTGKYAVGEIVDYFSASSGSWIPATVVAIKPGGTFDLDCKQDVAESKIRKRNAQYNVGQIVEYWSASQKNWIPAKVLNANGDGTYNLDCKPSVSTENIRPAPQHVIDSINGGSTGVNGGSTGSFIPESRSQGSWAPPVTANFGSALPTSNFGSSLATPSYSSKAATPLSLDAPVQLLRVTRNGTGWRYEVCPEGSRVLESQGSRQIAVASICGLYRTGKSYLLNLLLGRVQNGLPLFQVGGTTRACTEGLWLWGSANSDDPNSPLMAFLDCEGFGSTDSDRSRDAQLMTLCCLLSSVLVLNSKGALNESLFNSLALICKFAEHIEERGNEASRPSLLFVLRDFVLELVDQSNRPISPDEYLEQALAAAPLAGHDQARSQGAKEVRQNLLRFFDRRNCTTLVQPIIDEEKLQRLPSVPYSELRSEFRQGVDLLRSQLETSCRARPKTIGGQAISCFAFVALMKKLVESINDNRLLSVKGAWESVQQTACISLTEELRANACTALRSLGSGGQLAGSVARIPMNDEALQQALRRHRQGMKAEFQARAVGDEPVRREYWQELKEAVMTEEAIVRQKNNREGDEQLNSALREWQAWLGDDSANASAGERIASNIGDLMEKMPSAPFPRITRQALESACRRLNAARNDHARTASTFASSTADIEELKRTAARANESTEHIRMQYESAQAELKAARAQVQSLTAEIDSFRNREHELKMQYGNVSEKDISLKSELDQIRAEAAKHASEKLRLEEQARLHTLEKKRLEDELEQERGRLHGHTDHHSKERVQMQQEIERTRQEHLRLLEETRRRADEERKDVMGSLENDRDRQLKTEKRAGLLEGQVAGLTAERDTLRARVTELEGRLLEADASKGRYEQETETLKKDLDKLKHEAGAKEDEAIDAKAELERKRKELEQAEKAQKPKCGCILQ